MKKRILRINLPNLNGVRKLEIVMPESTGNESSDSSSVLLLCKDCYYHDTCGEIPHPNGAEDETFTDFCHEMCSDPNTIIGVTDITEYKDSMPAPYAIEKCFGKDEHMAQGLQKLINSNIHISIKDVVDKGCSTYCEFFKEDYSRCRATNPLCLVRGIFENKSALKDIPEITVNTEKENE